MDASRQGHVQIHSLSIAFHRVLSKRIFGVEGELVCERGYLFKECSDEASIDTIQQPR